MIKEKIIRILHEHEVDEGYYVSLQDCEVIASKIVAEIEKEKRENAN